MPLGCAPMAYTLWQRHLKHDPKAPQWFDRDRFVLSAGHGSMLLYSLLHLTGYDVSLDDLKQFRQWGSKTPGHPEWQLRAPPGVEATTGPLGQGAANAVGMAIAERYLATYFNRPGPHDHRSPHVRARLRRRRHGRRRAARPRRIAGHLGLGKLTYLYDANHVTLDGPLSLSMSEDVGARFAAYGWHVQHVENGDTDLGALDAAITAARAETERPSIIIIRTTIGYGSPKKAGTSAAHGSPLGDAEVAATKTGARLGSRARSSSSPTSVRDALRRGRAPRRGRAQRSGARSSTAYKAAHPDLAAQLELAIKGELPAGWDAEPAGVHAARSRRARASGKVMAVLAAKIPWLFGGDADLGGSTKTIVPGGDYDAAGRGPQPALRHPRARDGRDRQRHALSRRRAAVRRDVLRVLRLHAAGGAARGAQQDAGDLRVDARLDRPRRGRPDAPAGRAPDGAARDAAPRGVPPVRRQRDRRRLARRARAHARCRPGLVLSRQDLPAVTQPGAPGRRARRLRARRRRRRHPDRARAPRSRSRSPRATQLAKENISARVVSMPCWELFAEQDAAYRESVLPRARWQRVSVEAGVTFGWREYIGDRGIAIGIDRFGASAPGEVAAGEARHHAGARRRRGEEAARVAATSSSAWSSRRRSLPFEHFDRVGLALRETFVLVDRDVAGEHRRSSDRRRRAACRRTACRRS